MKILKGFQDKGNAYREVVVLMTAEEYAVAKSALDLQAQLDEEERQAQLAKQAAWEEAEEGEYGAGG